MVVAAMAPAVEARGLVKRFGEIVAVDGVDLRVEPGEVRGLLGPNGAGKTTLLRMLFGLVRPDAGSIALLGRPLDGLDPHVLDGVAGFVEDARFYPYLTARRNLELLALLDGGAAAARVDAVLDVVDLAGRAGHKVGGFSSGMRQRLGIAAALLREPRLLVLDEPTTGLDPASARSVRALLARLPGEGVTVLLSSHDMSEVDGLCDGVTIMRAGRVVRDGSLEALRAAAPAQAFRLSTSDDPRALAIAAGRAGVRASQAADGGLTLAVEAGALDAFVLALGSEGVAVRRLEPSVSPLEAMFFALTGEGAAR